MEVNMKKKGVLGMVLAASLVLSGSFTTNAAGGWIETDEGWKYQNGNGRYVRYMYIDGWYLDENGIQTGEYQASWKHDSKGWWYGDDSGWYAKDGYCYIDNKSYEFDSSGYLIEYGWKKDNKGWYYQVNKDSYAKSEWIDGYWIGEDGYWNYEPRARWYEDDKGKYYMDSSGYYVKGEAVVIDRERCEFDDDGYLVEYTQLQPNNKSTEVKFNVTLDKKDKAANQLQNVLIKMIDNDETVTLKVDGVEKSAKNENGIITFDERTLTDYINEVSKEKTEVEVSLNTTTNKAFSTIFTDTLLSDDYYKWKSESGATEDDLHFDYQMTLGGVTFSNFDFSDKYVSHFDVDGKRITATSSYWPGEDLEILAVMHVVGKHMEDDWVRKLVDSGVIDEEVYITR